MKLRLLFSILLLFSFGKVFAQNYPVQVTPQFLPPSPIYLSSYADGTTINSPLRVQLLLNDITLSNREVRLKIYIEGTGINLQGSDLVIGSESIYLDGGVPLTLTNELAPYYELKNMQGINPANYANPLSEGSYQFCFEVYDAFTGNKLSNKTCASTLIFQNDPPFLNMPFKNEEIAVNNPQNIVFQWTPRHINVSNVEYELSIVEIWDHYVDPQAAFFSMPPIFQVTTRNTSYLMGPSDPPLLPNKKYAWRVQAKALQGAEEIGLFKNHGYSEVYWFNHTQPCEAPLDLYAELKGASKVNIFWEPNPEAYKSYTIAYKEAGDTESDWYLKNTNSDWVTIWDLKPGTTYEYMVKGICELGESEYSESQIITTELLDNSDSFYSCGLVPDEIAISNREPLPTLIPGDEIYAGDFVVTVTNVSGSNGIYSGRGYVKIPYLNLITLGVTFNGILVNTAHQLAEGEIVTLYDPAFGEGAEMTVDVSLEFSNASTLDYEDIYVDGEIQSVVVNSEGNIVVQTTSGPVTINTQGESSSGGPGVEPGTPIKIKDGAGNEYTVVDGVVTQGGGESITNENSNELTGAGKALVTFEKAPQSKYGLDVYKKEYESTKLKRFYPEVEAGEKNYFVSWKALASGKMEPLLAKIEVKDNGLDLNKISFETNTGSKYTSQGGTDAKERTVQLAGKGNMQEEELYALYPTDSTALTLGRINTVSYDEVRHKVVVVPIGSSKYPGSATELQNGLNTIYSQAAVTWEVELLQTPLEVTYKSPLIVGEKGNNYISSLKEIINAYKRTKPVNKNTYYLFIADKLQNESGKDVEGYMLRGGQYGFIAVNSQNIIKTIAHELGHGAFHLKHAFSKYNVSETSDNLMSYSNGFELVKDQWDDIHNPALIIGLLESDEDGESTRIAQIPADFANANIDKSYTFMTLNGSYITLPKTVLNLTFSTGIDRFDEYIDYPIGALVSFELDSVRYEASVKRSDFLTNNPDNLKEILFEKSNLDYSYEGFISAKDNTLYQHDLKNKYDGNIISLIPYTEGYKLILSRRPNVEYVEQSQVNILDDYSIFSSYYDFNKIVKEKDYDFRNKIFPAQYELQHDKIKEVLDGFSWSNKHPILAKYAVLYNSQGDVFRTYFPNHDFNEFFRTNDVESLKSNYINLINHFYNSNTDLVERFYQLTDSENFGEEIYSDLYKVLSRLSTEQLEKIDFEHRKTALLKLLKQENVKYLRVLLNKAEYLSLDDFEDEIIRLLKFLSVPQVDELIAYLESYEDGQEEHLWHLMFESLDDAGITFWTNDNKGTFIRTITEHYYKSTRYKEECAKFNVAYTNLDKNFINQRSFISNYKDIFERTWIQWKASNPVLAGISEADFYIKYDTGYLKGTGRINVEKNLTLGFIPTTLDKFPIAPFDLILFRTTSNLGLLSDYKTEDLKPVPAIVIYYDDRVRDSDTKSDIVQTAFDLGTLVIPGAQITHLHKIGKLVYTLDKISSVTSIASNALENQDSEASAILGATSVVLGVADLTNLAITKINAKLSKNLQTSLNDYNQAANLVENASDQTIDALSQSQKDYVKAVMTTEHQALKAEGALSDDIKITKLIAKIDAVGDVKNIVKLYESRGFKFEEAKEAFEVLFKGHPPGLRDEAMLLFAQEKYDELYDIFVKHSINKFGKTIWPPLKGFAKISRKVKASNYDLRIDRFQKESSLGGGFGSPILKNTEGIDDLSYTYDSRMLGSELLEGMYYFEFKMSTKVSDVELSIGDVVPWFKNQANLAGEQIEFSRKLHNLDESYFELGSIKAQVLVLGKWRKCIVKGKEVVTDLQNVINRLPLDVSDDLADYINSSNDVLNIFLDAKNSGKIDELIEAYKIFRKNGNKTPCL